MRVEVNITDLTTITAAKTLEHLQNLIVLMRSRPRHSRHDELRMSKEYRIAATQLMFESGKSYGEVTGSPGTAVSTTNQWGFEQHLRSIDNDLGEQVSIVEAAVAQYFSFGVVPAPYYPSRIAIILRKEKLFDFEVDFLTAYLNLFPGMYGPREKSIAVRLSKAKMLAEKARSKHEEKGRAA